MCLHSININSNSLISSIKELLEIVNGIPPLNYTIVPDIYNRVVENISEEDIFEARCTLFNIPYKLKDSRIRGLNINVSYNFCSLIPSETLQKSTDNCTTLSSD